MVTRDSLVTRARWTRASLVLVLAAAPAAASAAPATQPAAPAAVPTSQPSSPPRLLHAPPAAVVAGQSLRLSFALAGPGVPPAARVRFRAPEGEFVSASVERTLGGGYEATIPAEDVIAPALEYYVETERPPRAVFASAAAPHRVQVLSPPAEAMLAADLEFYRGHRSQVDTSTEVVNFGTRDEHHDWYHREELAYRYRMLGLVHHIRLAFALIRGDALVGDRGAPTGTRDVGMYFGFAELRFRFTPLLYLDLRPNLGATKEGFNGGFAAACHIGRFSGTQVTLAVETLGGVGTSGSFRLGWHTVPRVPMGVMLEITNFPSNEDVGLRLVYDFSVALADWLSLTARLGYAARDSHFGGIVGGLAGAFSF